jgi:hypothetical protein
MNATAIGIIGALIALPAPHPLPVAVAVVPAAVTEAERSHVPV